MANLDVEGSSPKAFFGLTQKRRIKTPVGGTQTIKDLLTHTEAGTSAFPVPVEPVGKKSIGPGKNSTSSDWYKLDEQAPASTQRTLKRMDGDKYKSQDIFHLPLDAKPGRRIFEAPPSQVLDPVAERPTGIRHFPAQASYDPLCPPPDPVQASHPAKRMVQLDTSNKGANSFVPIERALGQRKRVDKIPGEDSKEAEFITAMPVSNLRGTQLDGFLARAQKRDAQVEHRLKQSHQERTVEARAERGDVQNLDAWDKAHKRPKEPDFRQVLAQQQAAAKPAPGAKPGAAGKPGAAPAKQASTLGKK